MREIKFEAWDKYFKQMVKVNMIDFSLKIARVLPLESYIPESVYETSLDNLELMQYTGLKDKNGVEIYDGYILKIPDDYNTYGFMAGKIREIYFKDGGFRFKPNYETKNRGHWLEDNGEFEVIGNIYENEELPK